MPWIFVILTTLGSLFFVPFTQDFYETNKWYAVVFLALALTVVWAFRAFKKTAGFAIGRSFWVLLSLAAAGIVSLFVASPNKVEAALSPFGPLLFAALAAIALFSEKKFSSGLMRFIPQPVVLLSVLALFQLAGVGSLLFPHVAWLADPLWTPAGSTIAFIGLMLLVMPLLIEQAIAHHKHGRQSGVLLYASECLLLLAALVTTLIVALPKFSSSLLPLWTGWQIMLEALKRFPATFVGVGPENFLSAFTAGRPPALNMTPVWNTRFLANASTALHLGATTGLLGLGACAYFLIGLFPKSLRSGLDWSRAFAIAAILFLPPSIALIVFCSILLMLSEPHKQNRTVSGAALIGIVAALAALGTGYLLLRTYRAEMVFFDAYLTEQRTNGGVVQRAGQKVIELNPYIPRYHEAYAQTNLILAAAVAQQVGTQQDATDEDRQVIAQLVSQAVREGKLATQLAPRRVTSWETLARLYQNLIGMADAADTWAIASYQKAVELDPTNPGIRLEIGSIYMSQRNFDAAIANFAVAAALKPDLANAHYNLANAYREKGNIDAARESLLRVQTLLSEGSSDYEQIVNELSALEASASSPIENP